MKVNGRVAPPKGKDKFWSVEIPVLGIFTQGKNQKDAYRMAADAIEVLLDRKDFKIDVTPKGKFDFLVSANDQDAFLGFILSRIRMTHKLTARDVSKRLKSKSPNAYARYEQGKTTPTIQKLEELLAAIDPGLEIVIQKEVA